MKKLVLVFIVFILLGSSYLFWQEAQYGISPTPPPNANASQTREVAIVANSVGGTVSLIDIERQSLISTFSIIPDGKKVGFFRDPVQFLAQDYVEEQAGLNYAQDSDLSPDGRTLYISRGLLGDVVALDLASQQIIWRTPIAGLRADHMDISHDGQSLFVTAILYGGDVVQKIETASGEILESLETGNWPHDVHVSPDGQTLFVASIGDMTADLSERDADPRSYILSIHDLSDSEKLREMSFSNGIRPFQISTDGQTLFGQQSNTHDIIVHDIESNKSLGRLTLPVAAGVSEEDWDFEAPHHGLALSRDGRWLCVAGRASDYAAIVSTKPLQLSATIEVGDAPSWAALSQDDQYCLIANNRDDSVSIISMDKQSEVKRIAVGRAAKHITVGHIPLDVIRQMPKPK